MQINDGNLLGIQQPATGQTGRAEQALGGKASRSSGGSTPGDAVQLSSFASKINELQDDPVLREARVEQLRSLYAAGQYEVDPQELAQTMVDAHLRG